MANEYYPLLLFPAVTQVDRDKPRGGGDAPRFPPIGRQRDRINPKFTTLQAAFEAKRLQLQNDTPGQEPELVIVLETIGLVKDFYKAVNRIPGLEWLTESAEDDITPDDDFFDEKNREKELPGRLFLVGSNQAALTQVLSLWRRYQANPDVRLENGLAPWKHVFKQLKEIRHWNVSDRIGDDITLYWRNKLDSGANPIRFEIEMWHFDSSIKNDRAFEEVSRLVSAVNGRVINRTLISEIAYHGALVELPVEAVVRLLTEAPPELVYSDRVMFFRPKGQAVAHEEEIVNFVAEPPGNNAVRGDPIIALLDGFPLQNHPLLAGRLLVDDPDGWEGTYPAQDRVHGTAMASLIALGDIDLQEVPLQRPIYVRPVLRPDQNATVSPRDETTPDDVLLIDLMHRAVKRIFEGDSGQAPAAPTVRVINLSLGDRERPFDRFLSPWARLIDWLSFKYDVLFIISVGNHAEDLVLPSPRESLGGLTPAEREMLAIKSLMSEPNNRPMLAPAESLNGLTVGAQHKDVSVMTPVPRRYDLFSETSLCPYSRIGYGFKRSIKPELLFPGGRILFNEQIVGPTDISTMSPLSWTSVAPGHRVASLPSASGNSKYTRGTSCATAIASRSAAQIYDVLELLRSDERNTLDQRYDAVLIKALLSHGANWGGNVEHLLQANPDITDREQQRRFIARWLGYGPVDLNRALSCAKERATMLGVGSLEDGQAFSFSAPLPPGLSAKALWKRLTITLAWFTPTNSGHQAYRRAKLWVAPPAGTLRVDRTQGDWRQVQRGTLQHEIFEGTDALAFVDGDRFVCKVNCAAGAGELQGAVPFALCVSLEVAQGVNVAIYQEISDRIRPRVEIAS